VIALLVSIGAIVALYFATVDRRNEAEPFKLAAYATAQELRSHIREVDSDSDGLLDWEEALWGTDRFNPDTDGDGIFDEEAARMGMLANGSSTATSTEDGSAGVTDTLAKEFFGTYLELKQAGQLTQANQEQLFQSLSDRAAERLVISTFTMDQLSTLPASPESKEAYRTALKGVLAPLAALTTSEIELITRVIANEPGASTTLAASIQTIDSAIENLLAMPVPTDAATLHLNFINALHLYARGVEGEALIHEDPIRAAASTQFHAAADAQLQILRNELGAYLTAS
jgi:hypothetical protein